MSDGQRHIPDTPTGPAPPEHDRDTPDLPRRDAGEPAEGNLVKDGQVRTDHPSTAEPQKGRSSQDEAGDTAAESVIESLQVDSRITKGSDPDSPVAGLLAAAAAANSLRAKPPVNTVTAGNPAAEAARQSHGESPITTAAPHPDC